MGLMGLAILIIAAVWLAYALFKFIVLFTTAVPAFIIGLFKKENRQELAAVEWDPDTVLGFVVLTILAALAIWLVIYLELPQAALRTLEILFF